MKPINDENIAGIIGPTVDALAINLTSLSSRTAITLEEYIASQIANGVAEAELEAALLTDLTEGGRIFGEFNRQFGLSVKGQMGNITNRIAEEAFGSDKYAWIAVLINTCKDCLPRHGQVDTAEGWERRGKPRTGWSICRTNCQCMLIPETAVAGQVNLKNPIKRRRK